MSATKDKADEPTTDEPTGDEIVRSAQVGDERPEDAELERRIDGLTQLGLPAATLAAGVYQDVLDGKVEWHEAEAEMTARESAA